MIWCEWHCEPKLWKQTEDPGINQRWRGNKSLFIKRWDGKYLKNKKLFKQVKTAADFWMVCEVKPNGG